MVGVYLFCFKQKTAYDVRISDRSSDVGSSDLTLSRTVMTTVAMVRALVLLLFYGPDVIFGFTAAMLFGVLIGGYSSVLMSTPVLVWLKVGPDSFVPRTTDRKSTRLNSSH